jgi:hypothetical protein
LLFTAAIVSNTGSVQQTLNIALDAAYLHVFIPLEALIWIRSLAIALLIVAHALGHVQPEPQQHTLPVTAAPESVPLVLTPELVDALRAALAQVTISEKPDITQALPSPQGDGWTNEGEDQRNTAQEMPSNQEPGARNCERVKAYLAGHSKAKVRDVAGALSISTNTANKWMSRMRV